MRTTLFLMLLFMVTPTAKIRAQSMPSMQKPDALNLPNCPVQLMGSANDIFYYGTQNCQFGGSGYGQSNTDLSSMLSCCVGNSCKDGCAVAPLVIFDEKKRPIAAAACDPNSTTLPQAIAACQARLTYLDKLLASSEVDNRNKGRIRNWQGTVRLMLNYLNRGSDPAGVKVRNYCTVFIPKDFDHDKNWSHAVLGHMRKTQLISDEAQPKLPKLSAVAFTPQLGILHTQGPLLKVSVRDSQSGDQDVYFKTMIVNDGPDHFRIGLEVDPEGAAAVDVAVFLDRHRHGHLIQATTGPTAGVWYLVSSHHNLEIKQ